MKAERAELEEIFKKNTKETNVQQIRLAEQAAVDKKKLTGDPKWDIFLQELQAKIEEAQKALVNFSAQLESPELTDPNEVQRIRNCVFICNERIGSLNMVINLPKEIIETGKVASTQLEAL